MTGRGTIRVARIVLLWSGVAGCVSGLHTDLRLHDDFSAYSQDWRGIDGSSLGPWAVVFAGYGGVSVDRVRGRRALRMRVQTSIAPQETHAALVVGPEFSAPYDLRVSMLTEEQLRRNTTPNPWEMGWLVWQYADPSRFYYFIPKADGWEVGKRDPAYPGGQRFLATGRWPVCPLAAWCAVELRVDRPGHFAVLLDGQRVVEVADGERPYGRGRVGFYIEDAVAAFGDVELR